MGGKTLKELSQNINKSQTTDQIADAVANARGGSVKKSYYMMNTTSIDEKRQDYKEGDIWLEGDRELTIYKGVIMTTKAAILSAAVEEFKVPYSCPLCKKSLKSTADRKFYKLRKKCCDCVAEEETKMRIKGTWKEYEETIIAANILSILNEKRKEFVQFKEKFGEKFKIVKDQGKRIEEWSISDTDIIQLNENIDKEITKIDDLILKTQIGKQRAEELLAEAMAAENRK